jgi:hypothetical protein
MFVGSGSGGGFVEGGSSDGGGSAAGQRRLLAEADAAWRRFQTVQAEVCPRSLDGLMTRPPATHEQHVQMAEAFDEYRAARAVAQAEARRLAHGAG